MNLPKDIATIPTPEGIFKVFVVPTATNPQQFHVVLINEQVTDSSAAPLVRLHSECFTGDTLGSLRCDCNTQLHTAMERIGREGGIILYMRQEGRGVGLANKMKAYRLQEEGWDTVAANEQLNLPADNRDYHEAADMLKQIFVMTIRLMTNNPAKVRGLAEQGIIIAERIPLVIPATPHTKEYLRAKKEKLHHVFDGDAV